MSDTTTASRMVHLSHDRRKLLDAWLGELNDSRYENAISRREELGNAPLSVAQEQLWFLDRLVPGNIFYNIPVIVRLSGPLDAHAFARSIGELVRRHEILRTTFAVVDGRLAQVILSDQNIPLPVVGLSALPVPAAREAEVRRLAHEEAQRPFDLETGPLIRATLLHLGALEHILLLTIHHIAADGWSLHVCCRDLAALYATIGGMSPSSPPLRELPIQYADYAAWQRRWLDGMAAEEQLSYWRRRLAGVPEMLGLPLDRPRPTTPTLHGATRTFTIPASLANALTALGRQEKATLYMVMLSAFVTLLHRYTGQEDIVVGSPIAGRHYGETEHLIGMFVNMLALRADMSGKLTFRDILDQIRTTALEAYAHQDIPFERVVRDLCPGRHQSYTPLFQVVFALGEDNEPLDCGNVRLKLEEGDSGRAQFDLDIDLVQTADGLRGICKYSIDLFEDATICRLLDHFQTLLQGIVTDPSRRLSDIPLLTEAERSQLLVGLNPSPRDYPRDRCIHDLFETQVALMPESVATVCDDHRLTYRELNARANQLAHALRRSGVGPDVRVGLCIERSIELVVGLLSILKAGGAYVPIDPAYPPDRAQFILADANAPLLLTQERLKTRFSGTPIICVDADEEAFRRESTENLVAQTMADNLAYVIYTSGSTGAPKGVQVPHRSLVNHTVAITEEFRLRPSDRVLQFASISFDVAAEEIFPSWASGATVVLRTRGTEASYTDLHRLIESEGLTVLNLPASYWQEWVRVLSLTGQVLPPCLRLVVVGSERLSPEQFMEWRRIDKGATRWLYAYGTTETTITTTIYEPDAEPAYRDAQRWPDMPIGRPISNTQVYVLDATLQPVPVGVAGQLYIGGAGLARGYLNRPALTTAAFTPHPFSDEVGARLYRTGDLARYLPDGTIQFLGRVDQQVKVRGFRIEPGEIEVSLARHPSVRDCIVLTREDTVGEPQLVAYVIPDREHPPSASELRTFLHGVLPAFTVPSAFVFLDAFPTAPNGKLDRRSLPAPTDLHSDGTVTFEPPVSRLERSISGVWQDVLHLEKVGRTDNFFDLGGHSLLMVRVCDKLRDILGRDIAVVDLFTYSTVGALAAYIARGQEEIPSADEAKGRAQKQKDARHCRRQRKVAGEAQDK